MRRAVVLIMTLGFIAVVTALVLWSLSTTQKEFDKVAKIDAQNQFNILFKDFTKMIQTFDINSTDALELFLSITIPPITEPKSGVTVTYSSESLMDRLNLNNLLYRLSKPARNTPDEEEKPILARAIYRFFEQFELSDAETMFALLVDTIDMDTISRGGNTEIADEDYDFRQGAIYSFEQFERIKERYYEITKDENIFKISREEFEKYFYLGDPKSRNILDCSATRAYIYDTMSLIANDELVLSKDVDICSEFNSTTSRSMKQLKKIYNISQYAKKKKYLVKSIIHLETQTYKRAISFWYDLSSKRISNIDKNYQEE